MSIKHDKLAAAFGAFNDISEQLSGAYQALEAKVTSLNSQLAEANSKRLRELAEKERMAERLQMLIDTLPGALVVLDSERLITQLNGGAEQMLGGDISGHLWEPALAKVSRREKDDGTVELNDGRLVEISISELPRDGELLILIFDVTETCRLRQRAERYSRLEAMGRMVATLAHQVRTPLSSALLYVSQLADNRDEPVARLAEKGLNSLRHIERLVKGMLQFVRGEAAAGTRFVLSDLLEGFRQVVEPQVRRGSAILKFDTKDTELVLDADKDALLGALLNIANNALQATPGGVTLTLTTRLGDGVLLLSLSDDGPGMDAQTAAQATEPFFTTRSGGTGLGLAVVRAVTEAHGGQITIETGEGSGTTVSLILPESLVQKRPGECTESAAHEGVVPG